MHESDSIVIIPTYNEKENIENIIRAVFNLEKCFHILIIDDGSPDGTAAIVHRLIDTEFSDRLFIIERKGFRFIKFTIINCFIIIVDSYYLIYCCELFIIWLAILITFIDDLI